MHRILISVGLVLALLVPTAAWAALEATAVGVKGKAEFRANVKGDWAALAAKQKLVQDNVIRTGADGEVTLAVGDNRAVITIHELSEVQLLTLQQADKKDQIALLLFAGRLWNKLKKAASGEEASLTIQTPAAIASVRGTSFYVVSDPTTKDARVGVWEGAVGVKAVNGVEEEKRVPAGFEIIVLFNKPLTEPKKMAADELKKEQLFNEQMDTLGVAAILGKDYAEGNQQLANETENSIKSANLKQRGEKIVRQDFDKLYEALTHLVADTGYVPDGASKKAGKKSLLCLVENKDDQGKPIPNWNGPYMKSDFKDPFGGEYTLYQHKVGNNSYLVLLSPGLGRNADDNIEKLYGIPKLKQDAAKLKAAPPAKPAEPAPAQDPPAAPAPTPPAIPAPDPAAAPPAP